MDALLGALVRAADTLHEGLIITDSKLTVLYANRRAQDLLEVSEREMKKRPLNWVHKDFSKGVDAMENNAPLLEQRFSYKATEMTVSYYPGLNSITGESTLCVQLNDLRTHQTLKARESQDQYYYDVLDVVMNAVNEWIVIVDKNGIITTMSRSYKAFLQDPTPEGKHVSEVIENTRMHHVIETGIPETDDFQIIRGNKMIVSRYPIIHNGETVGALGKAIFKDIDDFYSLFNKISKIQKRVHYQTQGMGNTTARYSFDNIIGDSPSTREALNLASKAARTNSNVLIIGESGTGKELFAHAIHNSSSRRSEPFITINCAAIPAELLESELFGYEQGAFTGASKHGKKGKFELAQKGTIFLDEIGDMPLDMQAKLLRVLQEKEIDHIGGNAPISVDVRVIAATNQSIEILVEETKFRKDLYYRLNVMRINLTPLRERKEEIPEIAEEILKKLTDRMGLILYGFTPEALDILQHYHWPGNVRELENVLERALNLLDDDLYIKPQLLPETIVHSSKLATTVSSTPPQTLPELTSSLEIERIQEALTLTGGNKKKAAVLLGISRAGLYKKLNHYNLL